MLVQDGGHTLNKDVSDLLVNLASVESYTRSTVAVITRIQEKRDFS